jgi:hypothetical protein
MKPLLLTLILFVCWSTAFPQCNVLEYCSNTNYNWGANCHGFAYRFLEKGYSLSGLGCGAPTSAQNEIIYDCVSKKGIINAETFIGKLVAATESDHTVILYRTSNGLIRHSAVKIENNNTYLSKFESSGPVKKHAMHEPTEYYNPSIGDYISYHKLADGYKNLNDPKSSYWPAAETALLHTGCTNCSCRTSQGWFIVNVTANLGSGVGTRYFGPYTWNVSGASIAYNGNSYIYVNKPGGGYVGVTTSSTFTYRSANCTKPYSKFTSFMFPSCSFGAYSYALPKMNVSLAADRRNVALVLPETIANAMKDADKTHEQQSFQLQVYDFSGRIYENKTITADEPHLELSQPLQKGIYIFKLIIDDKNEITQKFWLE